MSGEPTRGAWSFASLRLTAMPMVAPLGTDQSSGTWIVAHWSVPQFVHDTFCLYTGEAKGSAGGPLTTGAASPVGLADGVADFPPVHGRSEQPVRTTAEAARRAMRFMARA